MSTTDEQRRSLEARRQNIADRLAEIRADAEHWNRTHPDEEPIVIDLDLGPEVEAALRAAPSTEVGSMAEKIRAPWTQEQVVGLNRWQRAGTVHPFTCGGENCRADLIATVNGWVCPDCDYTQDWAHAFMAQPLGPSPFASELSMPLDETCPFCLDLGYNRPADSGEFWECPECGLEYGDCGWEDDEPASAPRTEAEG